MNAPVLSRRHLLGATAAIGVSVLPAVVEAAIPPALPADPDAELFRLLDSLPALKAADDLAVARQDALWEEFHDLEPARPDALRVRASDQFGKHIAGEYRTPDGGSVWFYEALASNEASSFRQMVLERREWRDRRWIAIPDEARIARRDEILVALDRWCDECDVVKERLGIPQTDDAAEAANDALLGAWDAILETAPLTLAGLVAKARWATAADAPSGFAERWERRIAADVVAMAGLGGAAS